MKKKSFRLKYNNKVINSATFKQNLACMLIVGMVLILSLSIMPINAQPASDVVDQNTPQTDSHYAEKQCERLKVYENFQLQSIRNFIKQRCGVEAVSDWRGDVNIIGSSATGSDKDKKKPRDTNEAVNDWRGDIDIMVAIASEARDNILANGRTMEDKGLGEFASSPMYDDNSLAGSKTNVDSEITTQETSSEIITNDIPEVTLEQNSVLDLSYQAPISPTLIELNGHEYESEEIQTMNSVSEFTLSAWVKPDYSKGSSEFTILSKEKAFTLTINNNRTPEKIVRFSIFDGFKWTIIESSSAVEEEWTHIAAKFDGHVISLYINCNLEAAKQLEGITTMNSHGYLEPQPIEAIHSESMILYGAQQITKSDNISTKGFFSGSIDEIVVDDHGFGYKEILDLCEKSKN